MKLVKRLITEFVPEHYGLEIQTDVEKMSFSGKVLIRGKKISKPSKRITLHQKGLKIKTAKIMKHDKNGRRELAIARINCLPTMDELRLHSSENVYPGDYSIEIEFAGAISNQMHGIYACNFKLDGKAKKLVATQFESHHAREAFPCIDEPEAKATFALTLKTIVGDEIVANMPVKKQTTSKDTVVTTFETTPRMSTYLLAFCHGALAYKAGQTKNKIPVKIFATPENKNLLDFSLKTTIRSLEFLEDFFGVKYALPKIDMLALPDFSAGAMENWGLITFRESLLLVDPKSTSIESKQYVATVIAHELAHQWFGNLVTMKWWDDLWLNESFANLMEYISVDALFPQWRIWEQFVNRELGSAMRRDSLPNVQAVRTEVRHPDELATLFDPSIVYAKGACILRMLFSLVGEKNFRKGLKNYFEKNSYKNTVANDLWDAIGEVSSFDVAAFMDNWLNRPGFPVVDIDYNGDSHLIKLSQQRLTIGTANNGETIWNVPLMPLGKLEKDILINKSEAVRLVEVPAQTLLLNDEARSYYVAHYTDKKHLDSILNDIKNGNASPINKIILLQNYSLLERANIVKTVENLKLLDAYTNEKEESVWSSMAGIIASARHLVSKDTQTEPILFKYMAKLVDKIVKDVGWEARPSEPAQRLRLRDLVLTLSAAAEVHETHEEGLKRFRQFDKPADLPADIRNVVYFIGAKYGNTDDFNKLLDLYSKTENADEKDEIVSALTTTRNESHINKLLSMIATPAVRLQDVSMWFAFLIRNPDAKERAWLWMVENWQWIEKSFGDDKSFDRFPRYIGNVFSKKEELKKFQDFFGPMKNIIALERAVRLAEEEIKGRIDWRAENEAELKDWLVKNQKTFS